MTEKPIKNRNKIPMWWVALMIVLCIFALGYVGFMIVLLFSLV
jgi:flagellar basal body-associated protein FliL